MVRSIRSTWMIYENWLEQVDERKIAFLKNVALSPYEYLMQLLSPKFAS